MKMSRIREKRQKKYNLGRGVFIFLSFESYGSAVAEGGPGSVLNSPEFFRTDI